MSLACSEKRPAGRRARASLRFPPTTDTSFFRFSDARSCSLNEPHCSKRSSLTCTRESRWHERRQCERPAQLQLQSDCSLADADRGLSRSNSNHPVDSVTGTALECVSVHRPSARALCPSPSPVNDPDLRASVKSTINSLFCSVLFCSVHDQPMSPLVARRNPSGRASASASVRWLTGR